MLQLEIVGVYGLIPSLLVLGRGRSCLRSSGDKRLVGLDTATASLLVTSDVLIGTLYLLGDDVVSWPLDLE